MTQEQLPFEPRERLALIRAACSRLPLTAPRRHNVELLLEKLESLAGHAGVPTETLAAVMHRSPRTVRRAVSDAEAKKILAVGRRPGDSGGNAYAIQWEALRAFARPGQRPGQSVHPPGQDGRGGGQVGSPPCQVGQAPERALRNKLSPTPPKEVEEKGVSPKIILTSSSHLPPEAQRARHPGAPEIPDQGPSWEQVEGELFQTGMGDYHGLARRLRGVLHPFEVLGIIRHWRSKPGAWGLGALHWRLRTAMPGEEFADRWPPESEAWRRQQRRAAETSYAQERRRRELEEQAAAAAQQAALDQLEAAHGAALDGLMPDELRALAAEAFGDRAFLHRLLARSDRTNSNLRPLLLEALSARAGSLTQEASDAARMSR
jgi:hypothetical protein